MSNEELYEYYGWKAHKFGFFDKWQEKTSQIMSENPKMERSNVSQQAFLTLIKEENNLMGERVYSPSQI